MSSTSNRPKDVAGDGAPHSRAPMRSALGIAGALVGVAWLWSKIESGAAAGGLYDRLAFAAPHVERVAVRGIAIGFVAGLAVLVVMVALSRRWPGLLLALPVVVLAPNAGALLLRRLPVSPLTHADLVQVSAATVVWSGALFASAVLACLAIAALAWVSRRRSADVARPRRELGAALLGLLVVAAVLGLAAKRGFSVTWWPAPALAIFALALSAHRPREVPEVGDARGREACDAAALITLMAIAAALFLALAGALAPEVPDYSGLRYVPGLRAPWWAGGYQPEYSMGPMPSSVHFLSLAAALDRSLAQACLAAAACAGVVVSWLVRAGPRALLSRLRGSVWGLLAWTLGMLALALFFSRNYWQAAAGVANVWPRALPQGFVLAAAPHGAPRCEMLDPRSVLFLGPGSVRLGQRTLGSVGDLASDAVCAGVAAAILESQDPKIAVDDSRDSGPLTCVLSALARGQAWGTPQRRCPLTFVASSAPRGARPIWPSCLPARFDGGECTGDAPTQLVVFDGRAAHSVGWRGRPNDAVTGYAEAMARFIEGSGTDLQLPTGQETSLAWRSGTSMRDVHASLFLALGKADRAESRVGLAVAAPRGEPIPAQEPPVSNPLLPHLRAVAKVRASEPALEAASVTTIERAARSCWKDATRELESFTLQLAVAIDARGAASDVWVWNGRRASESALACLRGALAAVSWPIPAAPPATLSCDLQIAFRRPRIALASRSGLVPEQFHALEPELSSCLEEAQRATPSAIDSRWDLDVTVASSGRVVRTRISDGRLPPLLERCIDAGFRRTPFVALPARLYELYLYAQAANR